MRALFIEPHADGLLDLALRAQKNQHDVRYWCGDRSAVSPRPVGRGLVECVGDWRGSMRWADLVLLGSNGYAMAEFDRWKKEGVRIIGAGSEAASWELDRLAGMQAFKRAGIPVPPYRQCATLDEAIAYTRDRDEGLAVKPSGDVADKSLSFVAKTGKEMVWRLARWKREGRKFPKGLILQDRIEGVEMAVGAWIGPDGFAAGWEENFEEKRLFAGGIGPNCYSADTEVLTIEGWKFWPDVTGNDRLATLRDGIIDYDFPEGLFAVDYDGEMLAWQSNRVDLLVTPDHNMYVAGRDSIRTGEPEWRLLPAAEVEDADVGPDTKKFAALRTARWVPSIDPNAEQYKPEWARLLGMYLADGYCRSRSIVFGNCPAHKEKLIRQAALACGYVAHRYSADLYINSRDLANQWRVYPKATEKRAPPEIMNGTPEVIAAFLDGLALDATVGPARVYSTASKGMADDIQIMLMRIGLAGYVRERDRRDEPDRLLNGHVVRGSLSWDIGVSSQALAWLRGRYCRRVPYKGKVYCATVPEHTLFVRRNGKACWSGNCGEAGTVMRLTRSSKLADKVLEPLGERLVRLGYVGNVDVNCIIDAQGHPWPLEFTMRFGYPAINIELALHDGDPIEFLAGLYDGKPPRMRRLDEVAVGVVMALPPYPFGHEKAEEVVGVPIWGVTPSIEDRLHLCNVMLDQGQLATAGSYVLVSAGTGETIVAARSQAYRALDRLTIPASPFWRIDIGQRLRKQLDELNKHGYARGLTFA